jgi:hypothetical protein
MATFAQCVCCAVLCFHAGSGALAQLAAGVVQAEPPSAKHRLVALALLETYVRYWKVLQQAQQYIPKVRGQTLPGVLVWASAGNP